MTRRPPKAKREEKTSSDLLVHIMIPIWGRPYILSFFNVPIKGLIHPTNLPNISNRVRISFLTTKADAKTIRSHKYFAELAQLSEVEFIYIDDLVVGHNYTTTLTLSYARCLQLQSKEEYFQSLFIFLNSDFYLANFSLTRIVDAANRGASAIFGTSLRVSKEQIEKLLAVEASRLKVSNRNLVKLALLNLHPTVVSMDLSKDLLSSRSYTKLYFRVSPDILLSRDFLFCFMGIVPIERLDHVKSYHDYSFVQQLADPSRYFYFTDSDDYLSLELQERDSEKSNIDFGSKSTKEIAKIVTSWTTELHRQNSMQKVIFHASDSVSETSPIWNEFDFKYKEIIQSLGLSQKIENHHHWINGFNSWLHHYRMKIGINVDYRFISPSVMRVAPYFKSEHSNLFLQKIKNLNDSIFRFFMLDVPPSPKSVFYRISRTSTFASPFLKKLLRANPYEYTLITTDGNLFSKLEPTIPSIKLSPVKPDESTREVIINLSGFANPALAIKVIELCLLEKWLDKVHIICTSQGQASFIKNVVMNFQLKKTSLHLRVKANRYGNHLYLIALKLYERLLPASPKRLGVKTISTYLIRLLLSIPLRVVVQVLGYLPVGRIHKTESYSYLEISLTK